MRTGFVAGDEKLIKPFLLYRTYHGSAMGGAVQHASIAAWNDEEHVRENRRLYVEKFKAAVPLLKQALEVEMPDASFYLWAKTPIDDKLYARRLYEKKGITVLPGSFLGREVNRCPTPGPATSVSLWLPPCPKSQRPLKELQNLTPLRNNYGSIEANY